MQGAEREAFPMFPSRHPQLCIAIWATGYSRVSRRDFAMPNFTAAGGTSPRCVHSQGKKGDAKMELKKMSKIWVRRNKKKEKKKKVFRSVWLLTKTNIGGLG